MEEITDEMLLSETINMETIVDLDNNKKRRQRAFMEAIWGGKKRRLRQ